MGAEESDDSCDPAECQRQGRWWLPRPIGSPGIKARRRRSRRRICLDFDLLPEGRDVSASLDAKQLFDRGIDRCLRIPLHGKLCDEVKEKFPLGGKALVEFLYLMVWLMIKLATAPVRQSKQ